VGSEDFWLRAVKLDGSAVIPGAGVSAGGAIRGGLAVVGETTKEWSFATSAAGYTAASSNLASEYAVAGPTSAFSLAPVAGADGRAYAVSATGALRAYRLNTAPAITLTEVWNVAVGVNVSAPLAVDGAGAIWSGSQDGKLNRTTPAGATETVTTLDASITDSPVILADGDVVVGDGSGLLHRVTPQGTVAWSRKLNGEATVDEPLGAPLVLAGTSATLLVPTRTGVLYALDAAGNEIWRHALAAGVELRAPSLHTPPDQPPGPKMSHAYVSSASGWLFSVVVDGELDAGAPWPKAFHDPRNTNRAGPQP
jgi:outer membrane protein assembly factor BamB